jgi:hypothetical protein
VSLDLANKYELDSQSELTVLLDITNPLSAVITQETQPVTQKQPRGSE